VTGSTSSGVALRLAEICGRHGLTDAQRGQLLCLLEVLASDQFAPTSVTNPIEAVDVHVADSLTALEFEEVRTAAVAVADVGSGAGFPGLALAVALPEARVTLVESARRKCAFIERARSAGGLGNVDVVADRVEAWVAGRGVQDVVTARAVAPLAVLCEYAAPLLRVGGVLVAWRGGRDRGEEEAAARASSILGLESRDPVRSHPYPGSVDHHLHLYLKVMDTPDRFPRRPGMASKRPLGAST
jgi:16S rRNA (guanine527-N7)-methyltransferase